MPDIDWELITRRLQEKGEPPAQVAPGPKDDPFAGISARLRSEALTDRLLAPTKADPRGHVLPTPGWDLGMSIANGLAQGWLPEMLAIPKSGGLLEGGGVPDPGFNSRYGQNVNELRAAREGYGKENSGKALVGELGGSLATMVPAMAMGAGALAPVGRGVTAAAPWASGIVDLLSGAGQGAMRLPSLAVRGAAEGAESAAIGSGLSDKPLGEQMRTGAGIGAVVNPAVGMIAKGLGSHVNQTTADSAQALLDQGVAVRAGQIPGANKITQGLDRVFGGGNAQQREAFAEQLSGKFAGYPTKEINQAWVDSSKKAEGQVMNDIQSTYKIPKNDTDLVLDLDSARLRALSKYSDPVDIKKINTFFDKLDTHAKNGVDGPVYKNIMEKDGLISNFVTSDAFRKVAGDTREIFDEAWGRALPIDKKAAWDQARQRYRVLDTIDNSMGATGAAEGVYNPKKLLAAVEKKYGNVENAGELGMLARGGQFLEQPGAAPASAHGGLSKLASKGLLFGAGAATAGAGGHVFSHINPAMLADVAQHPEIYALPLAGLGATVGGAYGLNKFLNSPRATQYLLDISRGSRSPMLHGNNPFLPLLVEGYNRQ